MKLLICGGGNGAHVLAGLAAANPNIGEARVLTLFKDEAQRWTDSMKTKDFTVTFLEHGKVVRTLKSKPHLVSKDPSIAQDCDLIVLVVPAFGHAQYLQAIKPYISPGATIVGMPGQAGFEFDVWGILGETSKQCTLVSFDSLPFACRIQQYGEHVNVLGTKAKLPGAIQYSSTIQPKFDPLQSLQEVLGEHPVLTLKGHILGMTMMGVNAYIHTAILYGKWKDFDGQPLKEAPLFYQGLDDQGADIMGAMSKEVLDTAAAIMKKYPNVDLSNVEPVLQFLLDSYYDEIKDKSSLQKAFSSNEAYIGLTHPMKPASADSQMLVPDYGHRYFTEDVPYGLVVLKGISEVVGVPTPVSDLVLTWCQEKMGKVYFKDGKIQGDDVKGTRAPQAYGFTTMEAILGI